MPSGLLAGESAKHSRSTPYGVAGCIGNTAIAGKLLAETENWGGSDHSSNGAKRMDSSDLRKTRLDGGVFALLRELVIKQALLDAQHGVPGLSGENVQPQPD